MTLVYSSPEIERLSWRLFWFEVHCKSQDLYTSVIGLNVHCSAGLSKCQEHLVSL